ncbi:MAG: hypothetical protein BGO98_13635 [Myxococcales bacterium 68-20]|nr:MAG: hypothetical protein BGO98_13635 [Myxococcales bacterium 68-20]
MGTSSSYRGPGGGTPLVPSWVDAEASAATVPPGTDAESGEEAALADPMSGADVGVPQPPADPGRFAAPRASLTRFATSGGTDRRSLGRAVSGYVSGAAGGSALAARRLGASRRATAGLLGFLSDVQARGVPAALRALNLEALAGRSVEEIFIGLADFVCPVGGTVDDGIARDAFIETIAQLAAEGISDLATLSTDQMQTVFEIYATHAIEARLCNDIGAKTVAMPASAFAAAAVEAQLRDFIRRGVADALADARAALAALTTRSVLQFVDEVYASAFEILRLMGEAEEGR